MLNRAFIKTNNLYKHYNVQFSEMYEQTITKTIRMPLDVNNIKMYHIHFVKSKLDEDSKI